MMYYNRVNSTKICKAGQDHVINKYKFKNICLVFPQNISGSRVLELLYGL